MDNPITLVAFSAAATQLVKKLGVTGDWLILVCVAAGGLYGYLLNYQPALLDGLSGIILALTTTGGVALAQDMVSRKGA